MAFRKAVSEPLERLRRERFVRTLAAELNAIGLHCSRQPVLDNRSADEILGYDETGRPAPR